MAKYLDENGLLYFWQKIKNLFALKTDIPDVVSKSAAGLAPQLPNETTTTKYLRQDGSWATPEGSSEPATVVPLMDGSAAVGTSVKYAREDHVHPSDDSKQVKINASGLLKGNGSGGVSAAVAGTDYAAPSDIPTKTSDLTNDSNYAVDASYVHTDNNYTTTEKNKLAAFGDASTYALKTDITGMYKFKGSVATASELPSTDQTVGDVYNIEASSIYGGPGMNVAWDGENWDPLGEVFTITAVSNGDIDTIVAS